MHRLINVWESQYYTPIASILLSLIAFLICIKTKKKDKLLGTLSYFIFFYIAATLISYFDIASNHKFAPLTYNLFRYTDLAGTITELIVFCNYIAKTIKIPRLQLTLKRLPFLFIAYVIILFILKNRAGSIGQRFLQKIFSLSKPSF